MDVALLIFLKSLHFTRPSLQERPHLEVAPIVHLFLQPRRPLLLLLPALLSLHMPIIHFEFPHILPVLPFRQMAAMLGFHRVLGIMLLLGDGVGLRGDELGVRLIPLGMMM